MFKHLIWLIVSSVNTYQLSLCIKSQVFITNFVKKMFFSINRIYNLFERIEINYVAIL